MTDWKQLVETKRPVQSKLGDLRELGPIHTRVPGSDPGRTYPSVAAVFSAVGNLALSQL